MRLRTTAPLLLSASSAVALQHAAPFLLISTAPYASTTSPAPPAAPTLTTHSLDSSNTLSSRQLATASSIQHALLHTLSSCPHKQYFVVSHPGLTTHDLQDENNFPYLRRRALSQDATVVQIPDVIGAVDGEGIASSLAEICHLHDIEATDYATPQAHMRGQPAVTRIALNQNESFAHNDAYLDSYITNATTDPYILIFTSTPPPTSPEIPHPYEFDEPYPTALHTELKRHLNSHRRRATNGSNDMQAGLPLFEKYQFLSPAIFMGLVVTLILLLILWVGVSAIAGLEVSYAAFSKDTGPAAQNKGKQQ
ncbi:BIG1-domain-containing protein [Teratosphaeria destructans]|uniref:Protein BIG1 n=1 Tax=Teratosphaeria destructans TaxID=418781 RepID=A0A9W7VYS3_9PEZI|nr:BIG1-domain-containing protein [Teratosphaeria destructans]